MAQQEQRKGEDGRNRRKREEGNVEERDIGSGVRVACSGTTPVRLHRRTEARPVINL